MRKIFVAVVLFSGMFMAHGATPAAASTVFLDEPFASGWVPGTDWIVATGSSYTPQIVTDNAATPTSALRLTPASVNQNSALIYADAQPTSQGLDVSFRQSQWGGATGADGLSFFVQKGTETSTAAGSLGGALGYSAEYAVNKTGLPSGLLGIGIDRYGNFVVPVFGGSDCTDTNPGRTPNNLTIRGPGNGLLGYCRLATVSNADTNWSSGADTRAGRARSIRITIDPSTVTTPKVKVWACAVATRCDTSTTPTLVTDAPAELLAESTIRFGFAAGTGGFTNNHEIWDLQVASINTFPAAAISTGSLGNGVTGSPYNQSVVATGVAPITFSVTSGALPPGLTLDANTGAIAGTPTAAGSYAFTIRATDNRATGQSGRTADQAYSVTVGEPTTTTAPTTTPVTTTPATTIAPTTTQSRLPTTGDGGSPSTAAIVFLTAGVLILAIFGRGRLRT